jgi:hypothetical protein
MAKSSPLGRYSRVKVALISALLMKLAKHLALIACLMIVGGATGRVAVNEGIIFSFVVVAALFHAIGRTMSPCPPRLSYLLGRDRDR